jgi:hypothetical protein
MPEIVSLVTYADDRGSLTVMEREIPFAIRRVFYMYGCADSSRGGHRHLAEIQGLVCVAGSCAVDWHDGSRKGTICLDKPDQVLILQPHEWRVMHSFTPDAVLLVVSSELYDPGDYVNEGYGE